jgi:hypothetical protein
VPSAWPQNYGHDASGAVLVPAKGCLPFDFITVLGFDEMRAKEKENDARPVQARIDVIAPLIARRNLSIVPLQDSSISLVNDKLASDIIHQVFVCMCVREEDFDHLNSWVDRYGRRSRWSLLRRQSLINDTELHAYRL